MRAYQLTAFGQPAEFRDVPEPDALPGTAVVRVQAAGICASDLHFQAEGHTPGPIQKLWPLPITLGHEIAGVVATVGEGVTGWNAGDEVLIGMGAGCGYCWQCLHDHIPCRNQPPFFPGIGRDGGLAPYVRLPAMELVRRVGVPAALAAPLPDAGATAYHAIEHARELLDPGEPVVVIGTGGVGHFAVAILSATTNCRIIAVDVRPEGLELAHRMGAHELVSSDANALENIRDLAPQGCAAVFDFAGFPATAALSGQVVARGGEIILVGLAGGTIVVDNELPPGVRARFSFGSSRRDVINVLELARAGLIKPEITTFPFSQVPEMYQRLASGELVGRGVALMDG